MPLPSPSELPWSSWDLNPNLLSPSPSWYLLHHTGSETQTIPRYFEGSKRGGAGETEKKKNMHELKMKTYEIKPKLCFNNMN